MNPRSFLPLVLSALLFPALAPCAQPSPREARAPSPYGVNAHIPDALDLKAMEKAGIRWARVDLTWDEIEPEPGQYRWDLVDHLVARAEGRDVHLLGILGYCPDWASSGPDRYYPPRRTGDWTRFVKTITARYRGCITYWCLWNEPNNPDFFHGTRTQYIYDVLVAGAQAAKAGNPDCKIVGPELAHMDREHWDEWLDEVLAKAGAFLDVIGHHCYKGDPGEVLRLLDGKTRPWEPPSVRSILLKRGQAAKPFWLTETGWRSTEIGEERQAGYLAALLKGALRRPWITRVFIYELKDSPLEPGYGLIRDDGSRKYSYAVVQGFIRVYPAGPLYTRPPVGKTR